MRLFLYVTGFLASVIAPALRADVTFQSGPAQVALIELYTSEGCSSCPPAEKWLGDLRGDPGLWTRFVPIAFHVNYWDHLGWRDALATKTFTQREYTYADAWRAPSVYTPCFARNGQEWHPSANALADVGPAAGELILTWDDDRGTCRVVFTPAAKIRGRLNVSVALLGGGIVSSIRAGENAGRELKHEFVALQLEASALQPDASGAYAANVAIAMPADRKLPSFSRRALVAWITRHGESTPLQAAGGWLAKP
jgi:hypothetical protein